MSANVYATIDDLTATALSPEAIKRVPVAMVNAILAQCSRTADMYLAQRYSLPLVSWGVDLTQIVVQLAAYQVMAVRGWNPDDPGNAGLVALKRDAVAMLKQVAQGNATLSVVDTAPEPMFEPDVDSPDPRGFT